MPAVAVAGILRGGHFSPNNVSCDAAILNAVAAELRRRGIHVNIYSEEQFIAHGIGSEPIVMAMTRDERSTSRLISLERSGRVVVNSGHGIARCTRGNMVRIFEHEDIPQPETVVVATDVDVRERLRALGIERCWVKRADCQTIHKEDVAHARHVQEAQELLSEFFIRGIRSATVARHVAGLHLKFYGVDSTGFFHYYFTADNPDVPRRFDAETFRLTCERAARSLGVVVYGGDAVADPDTGDFVIISFNDWPGFAPCRQQGAKAIARYVSSHARKLMKR